MYVNVVNPARPKNWTKVAVVVEEYVVVAKDEKCLNEDTLWVCDPVFSTKIISNI